MQQWFRGGWQHAGSHALVEPTLLRSQFRGPYFYLSKFLFLWGDTLIFQYKWFVKYSFSYSSIFSEKSADR